MFCPKCGSDLPDGAGFCASCGARLSVDHIGPYELRGEVGRGAMAIVWRAWDTKLDRRVAIKEPLFDEKYSQAVRDEMTRRFVTEAKTAARLHHPGIVTVFSADVYDNRPAIVMELIEGQTLSERLSSGPLPPAVALDVVEQLLDAVGYAHEQGIVHRDIKPDNVFIDNSGRVRLGDFGIAHVGDMGGTVVGAVLGTPGYMSPEQAKGDPVDARSDLFSVGVLAYEALTGRHPFGAGDGADATTLLYRICESQPPAIPDSALVGLPNDIRPAIAAALAKNPAARPQSAAAFKAMLRGAAPATVVMNTQTDQMKMKSDKPAWLPYVIAAAAGVLAICLFLVLAMGCSGGGGGGGAAPGGNTTSASATGMYYIGSDGTNVVIYTNAGAVYETTDIKISDLDSTTAANVASNISCANMDEARALISDMRKSVSSSKSSKSPTVYEFVVVNPNTNQTVSEFVRITDAGYVIDDSSTRALSRAEIEAMQLSDAELCIARNEIFARMGYSFNNAGISNYFSGCPWYRNGGGKPDPSGVAASNVKLILEMENARGSWYPSLK